LNDETTICAVATPVGEGGIGIVKVSGPDTLHICNQIFYKEKNKLKKNYLKNIWIDNKTGKNLIHGYIIDPYKKYIIDEVLLALMKRPNSYTREDVVEIQSHSGPLILKKILELLISIGAVVAEPGEFTKRAFLNGRIDLAQAEAIVDLIKAKNINALKMANKSIGGELSRKISQIREVILDIIIEIQAVLEFPEDIPEVSGKTTWLQTIENVLFNQLKPLIKSYHNSGVHRNGFKVGIIGRPNVGKSSLLNSFLQKDRAIVTNLPGTTRDVIEDRIIIKDMEVCLYDTAGIHESEDIIEKIGVKKTLEITDQCDLILFMVDVLEPFNKDDLNIIKKLKKTPVLYVVNKIDLVAEYYLRELYEKVKFKPCIYISTLYNLNIRKIEDKIEEIIYEKYNNFNTDFIVPNLRQLILIKKSCENLEMAIDELSNNQPEDLIVMELEEVAGNLGNIIGINVKPEIIDHIFNDFCIGK
jgi:tRNA modification GTPase